MTFDEARLMANVNDRAMRLFADGYRARWTDKIVLSIRSPKGDVYCVDTQAETCDCPFFQKHSGRHSCKHLLGWRRLLSRQRACRLLVALTLLRVWADLDDNAPCGGKSQDHKRPEAQAVPTGLSQETVSQETEATCANA